MKCADSHVNDLKLEVLCCESTQRSCVRQQQFIELLTENIQVIAISFAFRRQTSPSCAHVCLYTLRSFSLVFLELLGSCNPRNSYGRSCDSSHILPANQPPTFTMLSHHFSIVNTDFAGFSW